MTGCSGRDWSGRDHNGKSLRPIHRVSNILTLILSPKVYDTGKGLCGKWSRVDFAGAFPGVDVVTDFLYKKAYDLQMDAVWRCHVVEFATDQLGTHIIGERVIVFLCK